MTNLLSRKFIFAMVSVVMGFFFVLLDKVTADTFFKFVELIGGLYILGNVSQRFVESRK